MIEYKIKTVTPIFTSRGQIIKKEKGGTQRFKHIDVSGLSIKGNTRRFFRTIYYPFLKNRLFKVENELFGCTQGDNHASLFAFDIDSAGNMNIDRREISKRPNKKSWYFDSAIIESSVFSIKLWRHLLFIEKNTRLSDHARRAIRSLEAWLLFGGYGRRSRKGLGSFVVEKVSGKLCDVEERDSIFHDISPNKWSSVSEISKLIENLFEKIQKEEKTTNNWRSIIAETNIWNYKHPVISKYSVIAVGDTGEYDYTGAIRFIHHTFKEYKNAPYMKYFVGLSGSGRNPSQLMISLKRGDENSTYKFVLLFAPWIKNLPLNTQKNIVEDAQKNVLEKLDDLRKKGVEVRVLYP